MPRELHLERVHLLSESTGQRVLDGVTFALGFGEALIIRGSSGSGRSVLLEICAGLLDADGGRVRWDGRALDEMSRGSLLTARQSLGYVFQVPALISNFTVYDNIALQLRYRGMPENEVNRRVTESLSMLGLEPLSRALPEDLPTGPLRRISLARALVGEPQMLLLDDPTIGLDPRSEDEMVDALARYCQTRPVTVLAASNCDRLCRGLGARAMTLEKGVLV